MIPCRFWISLALCATVLTGPPALAETVQPALTVEVKAELPEARTLGTSRMRFFGMNLYEAKLLAATLKRNDYTASAFALDLLYLRSFDGPAIADRSLKEMRRVLKPQGRLLVLEFSRVAKPLQKAYDWYSFNVLPKLGQWVAGDPDSYRYLAESIRMHPGQAGLKTLMQECGFGHVDIHNLSAGVVALHVAIRC
jgi:SAM-dependent methyltransferase